MPIRVLIVDDSTFFRRRVTDILELDPEIEVVGIAKNGQEAVEQVSILKPDVVTMDIEMPVMDGITAVKKIMASRPVAILMFSSLTHAGAQATFDAMEAGALDFLPKKFEDIARDRKEAVELLISRVKALGRKRMPMRRFATRISSEGLASRSSLDSKTAAASTRARFAVNKAAVSLVSSNKHYKVLAVGTSTGGPAALQTLLTSLPENFPYPIILVQHMPGTFTHAFAARLDKICNIKVVEASHGDVLKPGTAYLAPGGRQMLFEGTANRAKVKITDAEASERVTYKPSVDLSFASLARVYGGDVLALILTGMGADGRDGCKMLKTKGAKIWAQDEASCVVFGMPQAVIAANLTDNVFPMSAFAKNILTEMKA
ncbi:chemotaxis response regulator protein-glutamate methylesterase [Alteromonadaceae bacterium BrNp21-10]|nr:chemotaxis response regulator protein-glutamate methylesterase [Alteromonadaceae bacterium BrNp21-10]